MTGADIARRARIKSSRLKVPCKKFSGAMATELLRQALTDMGLTTSARDVFVQGVPQEIDLIIPHQDEQPALGLMYKPYQVAVALEIKKKGIFGEQSLQKIRNNFNHLHDLGIACAYVTLEERTTYRYRATKDNLGFPCFTLAWYSRENGPIEDRGEWDKLLAFIHERLLGQRGIAD